MNDLRAAYLEKVRLEMRCSEIVAISKAIEKIDQEWVKITKNNGRAELLNEQPGHYAPRQR